MNDFGEFSSNAQTYIREILSQLQGSLAFAKNSTTEFSPGENRGGVVNVSILSDGVAQERTVNGGPVTPTARKLIKVPITLDKPIVALSEIDSIDQVLGTTDTAVRFAKSDAYTLAEKIETYQAGLYKQVPYYAGDPTKELFEDANYPTIRTALRILRDNKAPRPAPRVGVVSSRAVDSAQGNTLFAQYLTAGQAGVDTVVSGELGKRLGVDWDYSQMVAVHRADDADETVGTAAWGTPLVDGAHAIGDSVLHVKGLEAGATIVEGDAFQVGKEFYVVTADTVADGAGKAALPIADQLVTGWGDGQEITIGAGVQKGEQSMIFLREGMALALVPVDDDRPSGQSAIGRDEESGLSVRLYHSFDHGHDAWAHRFSAEMLAGSKIVRKQFAVRIISKAS